jgi:hypothetical protein
VSNQSYYRAALANCHSDRFWSDCDDGMKEWNRLKRLAAGTEVSAHVAAEAKLKASNIDEAGMVLGTGKALVNTSMGKDVYRKDRFTHKRTPTCSVGSREIPDAVPVPTSTELSVTNTSSSGHPPMPPITDPSGGPFGTGVGSLNHRHVYDAVPRFAMPSSCFGTCRHLYQDPHQCAMCSLCSSLRLFFPSFLLSFFPPYSSVSSHIPV